MSGTIQKHRPISQLGERVSPAALWIKIVLRQPHSTSISGLMRAATTDINLSARAQSYLTNALDMMIPSTMHRWTHVICLNCLSWTGITH